MDQNAGTPYAARTLNYVLNALDSAGLRERY